MNWKLFNRVKTVVLLILIYQTSAQASTANSLHYLEPGDSVENSAPGLRIFCHNAKSKYLIHTWRTLIMSLHTDLDTYDLYDGKSSIEVMEKHDINQRSWKFNWFGTKKSKAFRINPFEDTCIGIYTYPYNNHHYKVSMSIQSELSMNPLFYYITGVSLGVTFSTLILVWFFAKLIGRGKTMYLMVGTGWAMSSWLARIIWDNAQVILLQYRDYVIWYTLITSTISFLICYRIGPVTNTRTKQIIQWFLQGSGLTLVYLSSYFREASLSMCILLIIAYNFPKVIFYKSKNYWKSMFPERRKLLSENEYRKQGIRETNKALGNLREYCSSPESNPWKTVLRLKDPIRFAKFMEGDSHLSDDESLEHDAELTRLIEECEYTDDENDNDF
ncbi:hypothetical protein PV326_008442 [Microctonus aethiopoides]|nr:hypothetical protein PV326_008442 [Microctonus aethiopoides]